MSNRILHYFMLCKKKCSENWRFWWW